MTRPAAQSRRRKTPTSSNIAIEHRTIGSLKAYEHNPKLYSPQQIAALARSIASFGFTNPVLIDADDSVIAGHGRLEAARLAGLETVPVICLGHLSKAQAKAYRIADNRLAEIGTSWSPDLLQLEVSAILKMDCSFDIELTGFGSRELQLQADTAAADDDVEDEVPQVPTSAVTQAGDDWRMGDHRLLCGDALAAESYQVLLGAERPAMMFTDPPYNVAMAGHATGNGKARHREFVQASGEMSAPEFQRFLLAFCLLAARFCKPGALHYVCMDWRHIGQLLQAGTAAFDDLVNLCVWAKSNAGMGSLYRSQHELVAVFKKGKAAHTNNVELGKHGRHRSNLWTYAGMNAFSRERDEALAMHPTVKPVAMVRDAILDATNRGALVLDPFAGSGTTLIAAHHAGRHARLIELDPLYSDVIIERARRTLGIEAVLTATGENFAAVARKRGKHRG
ncbi:MAG: DNA methyltransferase [Paracoccaceae bacterium]